MKNTLTRRTPNAMDMLWKDTVFAISKNNEIVSNNDLEVIVKSFYQNIDIEKIQDIDNLNVKKKELNVAIKSNAPGIFYCYSRTDFSVLYGKQQRTNQDIRFDEKNQQPSD